MKVLTQNFVELDESSLDLLARNISNEVINGFKVPDFGKAIGASEQEFKSISIALRGHEKGSNVGLNLKEASIFRNALAIVLEELGTGEFQTRTGHSIDEGRIILQQLNSFLDLQQGGQD